MKIDNTGFIRNFCYLLIITLAILIEVLVFILLIRPGAIEEGALVILPIMVCIFLMLLNLRCYDVYSSGEVLSIFKWHPLRRSKKEAVLEMPLHHIRKISLKTSFLESAMYIELQRQRKTPKILKVYILGINSKKLKQYTENLDKLVSQG